MRIGEPRWWRNRRSEIEHIAKPIAKACAKLSKNKIGALIAIERDIGLSGLIEQGVKLDARLSSELLDAIFYPGGALHDLGVIIQRGRVTAAGCPFPLGDAEGMDRSIGSRHRAAIGLSLDSDAIVVVVSEETGTISIAENGHLHREIPPEALSGMIRRYLSRTPAKGWMAEPEPPGLVLTKTTGADRTESADQRAAEPKDDAKSAADHRLTIPSPAEPKTDQKTSSAGTTLP